MVFPLWSAGPLEQSAPKCVMHWPGQTFIPVQNLSQISSAVSEEMHSKQTDRQTNRQTNTEKTITKWVSYNKALQTNNWNRTKLKHIVLATFYVQLFLDVPRFSTECGKRSLSYLAPTVWNGLPSTTDCFKWHLQTHLFKHSINTLTSTSHLVTIAIDY